MEAWINEISMAFGNNWKVLGLLTLGLILCLFFLKAWRKALIVPGIVITIIIMNPLFYELWNKMVGRSYWRALWALPIIPVIGIIPALIVEKSKKKLIGATGTAGWLAIIFLTGNLIYNSPDTTFAAANNPDKLPDDVVKVGEALLELDDEPYTVSDASISTYLRQYSGKIKSMYGRTVVFGLPREIGRITYDQLSQGDYESVNKNMLNWDYEYLITAGKQKALTEAGLEEIGSIGDYGIYRANGKKSEVRTYNALHQIISVTYVNENGEPVNTDNGYSLVEYTYPGMYEYYFDREGQRLDMGSGYLHEFFRSINRKNVTVFIAVRDDASSGMTKAVVDDMHSIGIKESLFGRYRYGFYAVLLPKMVVEAMSLDLLKIEGSIGSSRYTVESAGMLAGDYASIVIDGNEYSKNVRGLNVVVYDNNMDVVVDSFAVDTFQRNMPFVR